MTRARWLGAFAACSLTCAHVACSDNPPTGGNSPGLPGTTIGGGDGGTLDSGSTDAGSSSDSSAPEDAGPPLCDPTYAWASQGRLPGTLDTSTLSQFGATTATELTLAWTASNGDVYIADRASTSDNYSTVAKANGATTLAADRVALSTTGKTIIAIASDRQSFVEFDRDAVGDAWTAGTQDAYAFINAMITSPSDALAEPVLGADKLTLFFIGKFGANLPMIYESRYNTTLNEWASPSLILPTALRASDATHRRRPTGVSSDRRTLFFYDEVNGLERGAWRDTQDSAFTQFVDLSGFNEAAPTTDCLTLYFQGNDGTAGVFTAD